MSRHIMWMRTTSIGLAAIYRVKRRMTRANVGRRKTSTVPTNNWTTLSSRRFLTFDERVDDIRVKHKLVDAASIATGLRSFGEDDRSSRRRMQRLLMLVELLRLRIESVVEVHDPLLHMRSDLSPPDARRRRGNDTASRWFAKPGAFRGRRIISGKTRQRNKCGNRVPAPPPATMRSTMQFGSRLQN